MTRLVSYLRLPFGRQLVLIEAVTLMVLTWSATRLLPFRWLALLYGKLVRRPRTARRDQFPMGSVSTLAFRRSWSKPQAQREYIQDSETAATIAGGGDASDSASLDSSEQSIMSRLPGHQRNQIWQVRWALRMAKEHLPWEGTCLPRALAGRIMLRRRGLPATVLIGALRGADHELHLHAWLTTREAIPITGVREGRGFRVLARFES